MAPVVPSAEDRMAAIDALGEDIGAEAAAEFDRFLPRRPWREYVAAEILMRPEVAGTIDNAARHSLYRSLADRIGWRHTGVLFEFLLPAKPMVLWAHGVDFSRQTGRRMRSARGHHQRLPAGTGDGDGVGPAVVAIPRHQAERLQARHLGAGCPVPA